MYSCTEQLPVLYDKINQGKNEFKLTIKYILMNEVQIAYFLLFSVCFVFFFSNLYISLFIYYLYIYLYNLWEKLPSSPRLYGPEHIQDFYAKIGVIHNSFFFKPVSVEKISDMLKRHA